jgi:hypothetical protein
MFARMRMRALARALSRRYFADGRSSYTTRFRRYELPKQAAILIEAIAAMMTSPDPDRRLELWVRDYLAKANEWRRGQGKSEFSGVEIDDVLARLGGRPSTLHDLVGEQRASGSVR